MSQLKRAQVVMLNTNEKAILTKDISLPSLPLKLVRTYESKWPNYENYHLYFLSDEEIKEGDWYYRSDYTPYIYKDENHPHGMCNCKKIIATTDKSLEHEIFIEGMPAQVPLPQPSQSFLEVYVKEYNKGNAIKEVMVEFECCGEQQDVNGSCSTGACHLGEKLKVNIKDNTITIKKVKDSWTRGEVIELIGNVLASNVTKSENPINSLSKWIEQNL